MREKPLTDKLMILFNKHISGIVLSMVPAKESRRYYVAPALIGWPHTENDPCTCNGYIFHRKHKGLSSINIIPSHWHDKGGRSPFSCKTRTYLFYRVNIVASDVLATQGASATMILTNLLCWTGIISSTLISGSHLSPPGALQSRRAYLQRT